MCLVAVFIGLQGTTVTNLRFGEVLASVFVITFAYIACLFLGKSAEADRQQYQNHTELSTLAENIQFRDSFVLTVEDKEIDDKQQESDQSKTLELLVIVSEDLRLDLLRTEFVKFFLDSFGGCVGVVATDVYTAAGLGDLAAHILIEFTNHHVPLTVFDEVMGTRHRDRRTFGFTDTDNENLYPFFLGTLSHRYRIIFVVLTVGDQDDRTAGIRNRMAISISVIDRAKAAD